MWYYLVLICVSEYELFLRCEEEKIRRTNSESKVKLYEFQRSKWSWGLVRLQQSIQWEQWPGQRQTWCVIIVARLHGWETVTAWHLPNLTAKSRFPLIPRMRISSAGERRQRSCKDLSLSFLPKKFPSSATEYRILGFFAGPLNVRNLPIFYASTMSKTRRAGPWVVLRRRKPMRTSVIEGRTLTQKMILRNRDLVRRCWGKALSRIEDDIKRLLNGSQIRSLCSSKRTIERLSNARKKPRNLSDGRRYWRRSVRK